MKNNDFDFIKNKFDNAQPEMPAGLDKEILKQKILSNAEHKVIKFKPQRNYFKLIATVAACFILILGVALALNYDIINGDKASVFGSYEEVNNKITELEKTIPPYGLGCGIFYTSLERKEEGYVKPEMLVTDGEYIYLAYMDSDDYINRNSVYIYKAEKGIREPIAVLDRMALNSTEEYSDYFEIAGLFVNNNRLVAVLEKSNTSLNELEKRDFSAAIIQIYDISDKANPVKITEFEQNGEYKQARMANGILYTVTHYDVTSDDEKYTIPRISQGAATTYASSKNIGYFDDVKASQYAVISAIDVSGGEMADDLKAVLGGSANIRCNGKYMYINEYIEGERWGEPERKVEKTIKLNLENGKFYKTTAEEVAEFSNDVVEINRGGMYESLLYPFGEYFISLGYDVNDYIDEIILFDKNMNELDSITFEDKGFSVDFDSPYFYESTNTIVMPAFSSESTDEEIDFHRGVVTFEIQNDKIVIKDKNFDTESGRLLPYPLSNRIFGKSSIIVNDTLFGFAFNSKTGMKCYSYKF